MLFEKKVKPISQNEFMNFEDELEKYINRCLETYAKDDKEKAINMLCKLDNHLWYEPFNSVKSFLSLENSGINTIDIDKFKPHKSDRGFYGFNN